MIKKKKKKTEREREKEESVLPVWGRKEPFTSVVQNWQRRQETALVICYLNAWFKVLCCIFAGSCFQYIPLELSHQLRI